MNSYKSYKKELAIVDKIEGLLVPGQEKALMVMASKLKPNSTIVEIGSFKGKSTACIGLGAPKSAKIYAIDTFKGNNKDFKEGVQFVGRGFFEKFIRNMTTAGILNKVHPTKGFSQTIGARWNKKIDLLFIDGSHDFKDVKSDYEHFYPWVKDGGIIALHDVSKGHPGVLKLWNTRVKEDLKVYSNIHTLFFGIKSKKKSSIEKIKDEIRKIYLESTTKKVFAIIPVHNRIKFTKRCLESLVRQDYPNIEVVVVDDDSTDGTYEFIKKHYKDVKIIEGSGNWWWTKSMNKGIKMALLTAEPEDFVLTMNNDCFFEADYISNIVAASKENYRSVVGSYILDAENPKKVVDAGVIMDWEEGNVFGVSDPIFETRSFLKDTNTVAGIDTLPGKGTLIPVEIFSKIGLLNSFLLPHYASDFEFFCRAKKKGVSLVVSKKAKIYNFSKETGSEHGGFHHQAGYSAVLNVLFSRKSKVNMFDHLFFLLLCCPRKYLFKNLKSFFQKFLNYFLLLFPFYYIKIAVFIFHKIETFVKQVLFHYIKAAISIFNKMKMLSKKS